VSETQRLFFALWPDEAARADRHQRAFSVAMLDLDKLDVDCYASSKHVPSGEVRRDPTAAADRIRRAAEEAGLGGSQLFFTSGMGFADRPANAPAAFRAQEATFANGWFKTITEEVFG